LRERFAVEGVELNTRDVNAGREVDFELHLNAPGTVTHPSATPTSTKTRGAPDQRQPVELAPLRKLFHEQRKSWVDGRARDRPRLPETT